jgi:hydrogenase maturation factor
MDSYKNLYLVDSAISKYTPEEKEFFSGIEKEYNFSKFNCKLREVFDMSTVYVGQQLLLVGYIGQVGTLWIREHCKEQLNQTLAKEFIDSVEQLKEVMHKVLEHTSSQKKGMTAMIHVAEGGIFSALWQMASIAKTGMEIVWEEIPIKQATIEFCEVLNLNPYQLYSGGCVLLAVNNGYEVVREFQKLQIPCSIIGRITSNPEKVILHGEIHRAITKPEPDELLKVWRKLK